MGQLPTPFRSRDFMITLLCAGMFVLLIVWWWGRWHHDLPALAVRYLCIGPFLPLVSLLNHNVDSDRYGTIVRTLPIYAVLSLMGLAIYEWRRRGHHLGLAFEGACLSLYAIFSLIQAPFSIEPTWAVISWSFSAPGYLMFFLAGRFVSIEELRRQRVKLGLAIVGFVLINVSLIGYGLLTGKATELVGTRNFGSVWAGNTLLAYLMIFGGLAWLAIRGSATLTYFFLAASLTGMVLSLSRTALMVLGAYAVFLTGLRKDRRGRAILAAGAVFVSLVLAFVLLRERLALNEQLLGGWLTRFYAGDVLGSINAARLVRADEFLEYWDTVRRTNPFFGTGFGTFRSYSIYSDAHDLLLTEAFENSLVCAVLVLLAFGLPRAAVALLSPTYRSIGMSIIGFLFVGQITGAMLSYRSWDNYYAAYPGWTLFFMVGMLVSAMPLRVPTIKPSERPRSMHADPA